MNGLPTGLKLIISIVWDVLDALIGRIPGFGTVWDIAGTLLAFKLWGVWGLGAIWEVFEPTDQIDGFLPTMTIIGLISIVGVGRK